jgi:hypothetical protein
VGVTPIAPQATPVKPAPTAFTRQIRHGCQNHSLTSWISMPKNTGTYVTKNSCIAVLGGDFSTGFTPLDPIEDHPAYFVSNPGTINPGEATLKLYIGGDNDD